MMTIFLTLVLYCFQPFYQNVSDQTNPAPSVFLLEQNEPSYQVVLVQETSEYDEEKDQQVPYKGFNVVAAAMVLLTIVAVAFVVYKVFQRMNKSRRGDQ